MGAGKNRQAARSGSYLKHGGHTNRGLAVLSLLVLNGATLVQCSRAFAASLENSHQFGPIGGRPCIEYAASLYNRKSDTDRAEIRTRADERIAAPFYRSFSDDGGFWNAHAPTRLTAPETGAYTVRLRSNLEIRAPDDFATDPSNEMERSWIFAVNGRAAARRDYAGGPVHGGFWPTTQTEAILRLHAGEFLEVFLELRARTPHEARATGVDLSIRRICEHRHRQRPREKTANPAGS